MWRTVPPVLLGRKCQREVISPVIITPSLYSPVKTSGSMTNNPHSSLPLSSFHLPIIPPFPFQIILHTNHKTCLNRDSIVAVLFPPLPDNSFQLFAAHFILSSQPVQRNTVDKPEALWPIPCCRGQCHPFKNRPLLSGCPQFISPVLWCVVRFTTTARE